MGVWRSQKEPRIWFRQIPRTLICSQSRKIVRKCQNNTSKFLKKSWKINVVGVWRSQKEPRSMLWVYGGPKKSQEFGFGIFRERWYVRNLLRSCENAKITRQIFCKKVERSMLWVYGGPKKRHEFGFGRFRKRWYIRNLVRSCENTKITLPIFSKKV